MNLNPELSALFQNPNSKPFESPQNKLSRKAGPNDKWLPPGYAAKTTLGLTTILTGILNAATRLKNNNDSSTENDFWFLWEVLPNEAEAGMYMAFDICKKSIAAGYSGIVTGGNATYIVGLVYAFAIFWIAFGNVLHRLNVECKCSRNGNF